MEETYGLLFCFWVQSCTGKSFQVFRFFLPYLENQVASFPVVLGDFGCDVTCQACRENSRYRTRFQASSFNSDSANWPGYEVGDHGLLRSRNFATMATWRKDISLFSEGMLGNVGICSHNRPVVLSNALLNVLLKKISPFLLPPGRVH